MQCRGPGSGCGASPHARQIGVWIIGGKIMTYRRGGLPLRNFPPLASDYGMVIRPLTKGERSSVTRIVDTITSIILQETNANRVSLTIVNDSSATLYVLEGNGVASPTNHTYRLEQYATVTIDDYIGRVTGVWEADPNDGGAQITEVQH